MCKVLLTGLLLFLGCFFSSCRQSCINSTNALSDPSREITEQEALSVAKRFLESSYEPRDFDIVGVSIEDFWKISFKPRRSENAHQSPIVIVDKESGQVVYFDAP